MFSRKTTGHLRLRNLSLIWHSTSVRKSRRKGAYLTRFLSTVPTDMKHPMDCAQVLYPLFWWNKYAFSLLQCYASCRQSRIRLTKACCSARMKPVDGWRKVGTWRQGHCGVIGKYLSGAVKSQSTWTVGAFVGKIAKEFYPHRRRRPRESWNEPVRSDSSDHLFSLKRDDDEREPAEAQFRTAARGFAQTERAETISTAAVGLRAVSGLRRLSRIFCVGTYVLTCFGRW